MVLIFSTLGKEQQPLSCLTRMSNIVMTNLRFFAAKVLGKMLGLDRLVVEPKKLLGEDQAPDCHEIPN